MLFKDWYKQKYTPNQNAFYINGIVLNKRYTCRLVVGFLNLKSPGSRVTDLSRELNIAYPKSSTLVPPNCRGAIFRCESEEADG